MDYKDFPNVSSVYEAIVDYYGEEKVDIKYGQENRWEILIFFPKITVTNEYGRSIDITKVFVRFIIDNEGALIGTFKVTRSEYTKAQYDIRYIHSHVSPLNKEHPGDFYSPCLGSGPIKATCTSLNDTFDINLWNLFCFELDQYLKVESVSGVPYIRLESISSNKLDLYKLKTKSWNNNQFRSCLDTLSTFIEDNYNNIIDNIPFSIYYNTAVVGMSLNEFVLTISNMFIDWYNQQENPAYSKEQLYKNKVLVKAIIKQNKLYTIEPIEITIDYNSTEIITFKGITYNLNVVEDHSNCDNYLLVLNPFIAGNIYRALTLYMNYGNIDKVSFVL